MRKIPKNFIDLSSSLKISGVDVTTHSDLIYMEKKKRMIEDPNKNTTLAKKYSASSSSEALEAIFLIQIRI